MLRTRRASGAPPRRPGRSHVAPVLPAHRVERRADLAQGADLAGFHERVEGVAALANLEADLYRFDLVFVDDGGDWRIRSAAWQPVDIADFLSATEH